MKNAKWVVFEECDAPIVEKEFCANRVSEAVIQICGLGFFELFINGKKVSDDVLTPVWSDYEPRKDRRLLYPLSDTFTHRIYYREYCVTDFLTIGTNKIDVLLGNGWYNQHERNVEGDLWYGNPKLCFSLKIWDEEKQMQEFASDETMRWKRSIIVHNNIFMGECHDFRLKNTEEYFPCKVCGQPEGELCLQTCPPDRKQRVVKPRVLHADGNRTVFDVGENISGYVRFWQKAKAGEKTTVRFSEEISADGNLEYWSCGGMEQIQTCECISDGENNFFEPHFIWCGFRYFEVTGSAQDVEAVVVHSDVKVTSSFRCDSEALNWLYDSYIRTQLDNMHCGVVSDCPHRERLGYTGDGQLVCDTSMLLLDSKELYKKWIRDIADCQDPQTGHVQHTAPFYGGGGGPGGWGCAIVSVPYFYYRHFGDKEVIEEYLPYMEKWVAYMESRSDRGIVEREEEGGWCLGEWHTPTKVAIPESYVNTYFLIRSLQMIIELMDAVGRDPSRMEQKMTAVRDAFRSTFYNASENTYCGGVQGANAFALDIGMGNEDMLASMASYYDGLGEFDTGIFGTEIVVRVLFENGYRDVAYKLLASEKENSFSYQRKAAATTLWEGWKGGSHNHPMFGACTCQLFYAILGIRQKAGSTAFREMVIAPQTPKGLLWAEGSVDLPIGKVFVRWQKEQDDIVFEVCLPEGFSCEFLYGESGRILRGGRNLWRQKQSFL